MRASACTAIISDETVLPYRCRSASSLACSASISRRTAPTRFRSAPFFASCPTAAAATAAIACPSPGWRLASAALGSDGCLSACRLSMALSPPPPLPLPPSSPSSSSAPPRPSSPVRSI